MSKEEAFSEDELDDVENDMVVPMSMPMPQPVVMSGPYATQPQEGESRSSAYNERLSRARTALTQQRQNKFTGGRPARGAFRMRGRLGCARGTAACGVPRRSPPKPQARQAVTRVAQ